MCLASVKIYEKIDEEIHIGYKLFIKDIFDGKIYNPFFTVDGKRHSYQIRFVGNDGPHDFLPKNKTPNPEVKINQELKAVTELVEIPPCKSNNYVIPQQSFYPSGFHIFEDIESARIYKNSKALIVKINFVIYKVYYRHSFASGIDESDLRVILAKFMTISEQVK